MILSLAIVLASSPFQFPAEPIPAEMARGEKVYYQRKGIERTLMEDRAVVGKWFDGKTKRDTDQIIWLSPRMVSRWLGYLNAKEKWGKSELNRRWTEMVQVLDGKMTFVAELYALPKKEDFFELTESSATKPETALNVRFLVTYLTDKERDDAQHIETMVRKRNPQSPLEREEPSIAPLAVFKGYDTDLIQRWQWHSLDEAFAPLSPEFAQAKRTAYDGVVGDHLRAIYVVQATPPDKPMPWNRFEVRVFAIGKEPVAKFKLPLTKSNP
ncbi:MAG: hypothetical protein H7Y17_12540 [Chlorobia bacterium]|nr:hypothetical protein [Fimbriimonadaceae bacterium]